MDVLVLNELDFHDVGEHGVVVFMGDSPGAQSRMINREEMKDLRDWLNDSLEVA